MSHLCHSVNSQGLQEGASCFKSPRHKTFIVEALQHEIERLLQHEIERLLQRQVSVSSPFFRQSAVHFSAFFTHSECGLLDALLEQHHLNQSQCL